MKSIFLFFFLCSIYVCFSQTESVVARKIQRFENTQRDIKKVCQNKEVTFKDSIFHLVEQKRIELSPNCPLSVLISGNQENRSLLIENWYLSFPLEYKNYLEFLERLIRSNI